MSLKELFNKQAEKEKELIELKVEIESEINNVLKGIDFKKYYVEIFNNEFTIELSFGSVFFEELLTINKLFKKQGFKLYKVSDAVTFGSEKQGVILYFKMK